VTTRPADSLGLEERALEETLSHLRRHGAGRTTVLSIAAALGVSHAALYRYFPSKGELFDAAVARALRPLEAEMRAIVDAPDPAADKLERLIHAVNRAYRVMCVGDPELFALLSQAAVAGRGAGRKHRARVQAAVQRVVEEGIGASAFALPDARRGVAFVFDALHRFIHPVSVGLDSDAPGAALSQRLDRLTRVVTRALTSGRV
jgi:AcrR family transcriptional regulator